jgi:hypothetical protein
MPVLHLTKMGHSINYLPFLGHTARMPPFGYSYSTGGSKKWNSMQLFLPWSVLPQPLPTV